MRLLCTSLSKTCFSTAFISRIIEQGEDNISGAAAATAAFAQWYIQTELKQDIEPELMRRKPLSMFQHGRVFSVNQTPGEQCDTLDWTTGMKHVVVLANNHWYTLDVVTADNTVVPYPSLYKAYKAIHDDAFGPNAEPKPAVQALSTGERTLWAQQRAQLLSESAANRASVQVIETALFAW